MPSTMLQRLRLAMVFVFAILLTIPAIADTTPHSLAGGNFTQDWSNTGLITTNDSWSGVPSITGYLGDDASTTSAPLNPSTGNGLLDYTNVDVIANQGNPNTLTNGGVAEFEITNPVVAFQGSGSADYPNIVLYLDTTGVTDVHVAYNIRDIDGSADNAIQPVAIQYRIGNTGSYTNIPAGFVADATTGPSSATLVTPVVVTLPAAADNQALVTVRIITGNATGSDEWVGIDDIVVSHGSIPPTVSGAANPSTVVVGTSTLLTGTVTPGQFPASTNLAVTGDLSSIGGSATQTFFDDATNGDVTAGDNVFSYLYVVPAATATGAKNLPISVTDAETRTGNGTISLDVVAAIPPSVAGAASPSTVSNGDTTLLTATVTPGNPPGATHTVTGDLTAIGGSATQSFFDDGSNGDVTPGDNVFSFSTTVTGATAGAKTLPLTVTDNLGASNSGSISLTVVGITPINQIQGPGNVSPIAIGTSVTTRGIVTARRTGSFYMQSAPGDVDSDPNTSEGILVFGTPSADAQVGNFVVVTATVDEFKPGTNAGSSTVTELKTPTVTLVSTGNTLPTPVTLTSTMTDPAGDFFQLEKYEGMRVQGNITATAGSEGGVDEETGAQYADYGDFHAVITGVDRPAREAGVSLFSTLPPGAPCCVPVFDENPETIRVNSDGVSVAYKLQVAAGATMDIVGVLDYDKGPTSQLARYTIVPTEVATNVDTPSATPVSAPTAGQITVGSFNVERLFDTVNDPDHDDAVPTAAYLALRLGKLSLAVRDVMQTPDIIGVVEVENLAVLQQLADKINADAVTAGDPNPAYVPYLLEGNDVGGIDVGYLVKSSRVTVVGTPFQINPNVTWDDPNCTTNCPPKLHDRPSLVLTATVNTGTFPAVPVTVIVNHLRSMNGVETDRTQTKRKLQAEDIALWMQLRQAANPTERIISIGDFNAFHVNDGYVDVVGTLVGEPAPATEVVKATADIVNPDLVLLTDDVDTPQQYSYEFDGYAQAIDHAMLTSNVAPQAVMEYARNNADFPETYRVDGNRPERASDHDMPVVFINTIPHLTLQMPASVETGVEFLVTVTARNGDGSVNTGYTGTVEFISSDASAILPADYTFVAGDNGVHVFNVTFVEIGPQRLRVRDIADNTIMGERTANVVCSALIATASSNGPVCVGGTLSLSVDLTGASYDWTGPNGFVSTLQNPSIASVTAAAAGTYDVTVTLANGCQYGDSVDVTIEAPLAATTISAPASVCASSAGNTASVAAQTGATYLWTITGGTITAGAGTQSITFTAGASGTVALGVTLSNSCGNVTDDANVAITLPPAAPTISAPIAVCPSGSGTASTTIPAGATIAWSVVNGTLDSGQGTATITFTAGTTGTVDITAVLTDSCGSGNTTINVPIAAAPVAVTITSNKSVAVNSTGNTASVPAQSGVTYTWSLSGGTITAGQGTNSIEFSAGAPGTTMTLGVTATLDNGGCTYGTGTKKVSVDFLDVPPTSGFREFVNTIARNGITGGCGGGNFCPSNSVTRAQMAVFLLVSKEGTSYAPPAATGTMFNDVPANSFAAAWIEELARRGITGGCGGGNYCPTSPVTRAQMAVFLLVTKEGTSYSPVPATGIFGDVPVESGFAKWIEELYNRGITGGCSVSPLLYCPSNAVTRAQMAVFLTANFGLE